MAEPATIANHVGRTKAVKHRFDAAARLFGQQFTVSHPDLFRSTPQHSHSLPIHPLQFSVLSRARLHRWLCQRIARLQNLRRATDASQQRAFQLATRQFGHLHAGPFGGGRCGIDFHRCGQRDMHVIDCCVDRLIRGKAIFASPLLNVPGGIVILNIGIGKETSQSAFDVSGGKKCQGQIGSESASNHRKSNVLQWTGASDCLRWRLHPCR